MEGRALSEADKQRKYQSILEATLRLFRDDRKLHTAARIAKEANIAKGTVYLYFQTKEEIYMELLVSNFTRWHEAFRNHVLDHKPGLKAMIEYMCRSLADFTVFVDLVSLASLILEENLTVAYVRQARLRMRQESVRSSQLLARSYPAWDEASCLRNLMRFYTYAIAHWRDCFPAAQVVAALPQEFGTEEEQRQKYFHEILAMNGLIWGSQPRES